MIDRRAFGGDPDARLRLDEGAAAACSEALARCASDAVARRVWEGDHTLWKPEPADIANRLGWLRAPAAMRPQLEHISGFVAGVRRDGLRQVLLLGMGGSSLAPELFTACFGSLPDHPRVSVLDSTDPGAVREAAQGFPPETTLYLVSTKSGGTVETLSLFKYFHAAAVARLGTAAGGRFAAITDPGSSLAATAARLGARSVFLSDPDVGGRFSALTHFGLVPAALDGVDPARLLDRAEAMAARCGAGVAADENPGIALGALAGALAARGRDKLTLVCSEAVRGFGAWAEQLIAESTGKEGRGVLPVAGERAVVGARYGADRFFVFLLLRGDSSQDAAAAALAAAGHPVLELRIGDAYDLGAEFFRWEFATAVLGRMLGVNPFDQPDVESAKVEANRALAAFRESGALPAPTQEVAAREASAPLLGLLAAARPGDYCAVQAFVHPRAADGALRALAEALRERTGCATTLGYGPRFLHSTGQLHKGGPAGGIFLQLVSTSGQDALIPDDFGSAAGAVGFGTLKNAQSLGDLRALERAGRRVLRVRLEGGPEELAEEVRALTRAVAAR